MTSAVPVSAQETGDETIRINSALVSMDVLVLDKRTGERVDGLQRENFEITDDGRPQALAFFNQGANAKQPLALVLLIDASRLMTEVQALRLRAALRRAMSQLQTGDQVAVINLSSGYKVVQALTNNTQDVLESLTPRRGGQEDIERRGIPGESNIAAALLAAVHHVQERRQQFRIELVVVSDKLYEPFQRTAKSAVEQLLASGAVINGIVKSKGRNDALDYICEQTGGEIINVRGIDYSSELERVIDNLAERYSIGFIPENTHLDNRFHKLDITVKVPAAFGNRRKLAVRARRNYVAGSPVKQPE